MMVLNFITELYPIKRKKEPDIYFYFLNIAQIFLDTAIFINYIFHIIVNEYKLIL